jgi:hypothetical protein
MSMGSVSVTTLGRACGSLPQSAGRTFLRTTVGPRQARRCDSRRAAGGGRWRRPNSRTATRPDMWPAQAPDPPEPAVPSRREPATREDGFCPAVRALQVVVVHHSPASPGLGHEAGGGVAGAGRHRSIVALRPLIGSLMRGCLRLRTPLRHKELATRRGAIPQ